MLCWCYQMWHELLKQTQSMEALASQPKNKGGLRGRGQEIELVIVQYLNNFEHWGYNEKDILQHGPAALGHFMQLLSLHISYFLS